MPKYNFWAVLKTNKHIKWKKKMKKKNSQANNVKNNDERLRMKSKPLYSSFVQYI